MKNPLRKKRVRAAALAATGLLALLGQLFGAPGTAQAATAGIHVSNGRVVEGNGSDFVMRGVSHAYVWYPGQTSAIGDIAAKGSNTVRVVLGGGNRWTKTSAAEISTIIGQCKQHKLICVLEDHDTTGYGEDGAAASLDQAVAYWKSVKSALDGQESYVVINIGNEPWGNNNTGQWTSATQSAIGQMRAAGFHHALMVDAPNWGQDWSATMRNNASTVLASDPDHNTIFSVHMYGVYNSADKVNGYLNSFLNAHLPIVIGEFGFKHSDGDVDEDTIMATAQSKGLGYLGWSWSGNGGDVSYLDMVNGFNPGAMTTWGSRIFDGVNGIASTARIATVYGGGGTGGGGTAPNGYPYCVNGSASDPDGDGWGWESNASCVVRGGHADGAGTAPNGYPYCVNGSASDPDGDGWGWENNASCVVRGSRAD
ncbi:cellulase family glycosylhydrolase [Streptomyces sp. NPDC052292]|uniref:cellulase family glycosylhydrolase n=1 Tax=Streptomyces sp. NPDC052292 TaxID=3155053 RepID=UPI003426067F